MNEKEYKVKIETITPAIASKWLETSPRNRKINPKRVAKYADDMKNGKWSPATMVIINDDGELVDAHHRMEAVVSANTSVKMVVFYGLEKKYIPYIDTGRSRTAGDMLAFIEGLDGVPSLQNKSTIARIVLALKSGNAYKMIGFDDIADFILNNTAQVSNAYRYYNMVKPIGGTLAVGAAAYLLLEKNQDHDMVDSFFVKVGNGENLQSGMPEYALRNALFTNGKRGGGEDRQHRDLFFVLTAWNDLITGATRKQFKVPKKIETKDLLCLF